MRISCMRFLDLSKIKFKSFRFCKRLLKMKDQEITQSVSWSISHSKLNFLTYIRFPLPPDSIVKYMYQIKFIVFLKTIATMLSIAGFAAFASHFMKKVLYLWCQKPEKLLKIKYFLRLVGFLTFFYYFAKELFIGAQYQSTTLKMRFISSYIFVVFICKIMIPILQYKSMIMVEFFTVSFLFISYTMTYPCIFQTVLQLLYEVSVLVI